MPYSRSKQKRLARPVMWPDLRYSPTGECKLFASASEVPPGWTARKDLGWPEREVVRHDREELISRLKSRGITINPTWGTAQMKKVLDG